jgi:hypothetical protein
MGENIIKVECGACDYNHLYMKKEDLETIKGSLKDDEHKYLSLLCSKCFRLLRNIPIKRIGPIINKFKICQRIHKINIKSQNIMSMDAINIDDEKILILEVQ